MNHDKDEFIREFSFDPEFVYSRRDQLPRNNEHRIVCHSPCPSLDDIIEEDFESGSDNVDFVSHIVNRLYVQ